MKTINGKLATVLVAATIGIAGVFVPSTARASHELNVTDPKAHIDENTDSSTLENLFGLDFVHLIMLTAYESAQSRRLYRDNRAKWQQDSDASGDFGTGMAAGSLFGLGEDVTVWASGSHTSSENDFAATAYKSDTNSASFGGDIRVDEIATLGAFVSFSNTDTTSSFNNGGSETDAVSFGPYISAKVNDNVNVDASFGFMFLDIDNFRTPGGAARITGGQRGTGMFGAANVNYSRWMEALNLNGRVGVTASNVRNRTYVDSTATLIRGSSASSVQLQIEGQASYYFDNFAPFARVGYSVEASPDVNTAPGTLQPANDKDEITVGGGVNLFGYGPISGGISYSRTLGRAEFDSWTVTGQISVALGGG